MIKDENILKHLNEINQLRLEQEQNYEYYGDSVIAGCDCGCGGDSMMDDDYRIQEEIEEHIAELKSLGYNIENLYVDLDQLFIDNPPSI